MTDELIDDPFSTAADPYPPAGGKSLRARNNEGENRNADACQACRCSATGISLSRRQALIGVTSAGLTVLGAGTMAFFPVVAQSAPFLAPCVQSSQKPQACRHRFCRHYGGEGDYYGR